MVGKIKFQILFEYSQVKFISTVQITIVSGGVYIVKGGEKIICDIPKTISWVFVDDGDTIYDEVSMALNGVYLYVFYCLCYIYYMGRYLLEGQLGAERDPNLYINKYISIFDDGVNHWNYMIGGDI